MVRNLPWHLRQTAVSCGRFILVAIGITAFILASSNARGENLNRVEEDWQLVIREPAANGGLPQVTTTMSPVGSLVGIRWLFTINLDSPLQTESGGMRLMSWQDDRPGPARLYGVGTRLRYINEEIRWTQVMAIDRGLLYCAVIDGDSDTWGRFGQGKSLMVPVATQLRNLNDYSPSVSYYSSGISGTRLAPTRVRSLVLRQVRYYSSAGLQYLDNEPKVVYAH